MIGSSGAFGGGWGTLIGRAGVFGGDGGAGLCGIWDGSDLGGVRVARVGRTTEETFLLMGVTGFGGLAKEAFASAALYAANSFSNLATLAFNWNIRYQ